MLDWKDAKGLLLTEEAFFKGFKYQVFWGVAYEQENARIYQGDKIISQTSSGDRNFGNKYCKNFCERHARKQINIIEKVCLFLKKERGGDVFSLNGNFRMGNRMFFLFLYDGKR